METIKIKDLQTATSMTNNDYMVIEKTDGTRKISCSIFESLAKKTYVDGEIYKVRTEIGEANQQIDEKLEPIRTSVGNVDLKIDSNVSDIISRIEGANTDIQEVNTRLSAMYESMDDEVTSAKQNIADIEQGVTRSLEGISSNIENINTEITEVKRRIEENTSNEYVDVKKLGAKGDGVSIDREFIQTALNTALENSGVNVYIPDGVYIIDQPLSIFSNTHLKLSKNAIIRRKSSGSMLINGLLNGSVQYGDILIEGGSWDMDNQHTEYKDGSHFILGNADNIHIRDVRFLNNHGNHAIHMGGIQNSSIRDCSFLGMWANPNGERNYVEAVQISEFTADGQPSFSGVFNNRPSKNVLVENCAFDRNINNGRYGYWTVGIGNSLISLGDLNENIKIRNCRFVYNSNAGVRTSGWTNVVIEGCRFGMCSEGICLTSSEKGFSNDEITLKNHRPTSNVKIIDCDFIASKNYDIWTKGKVTAKDDTDICYTDSITIQGCTFKDNASSQSSVHLELAKNIIVENCNFDNIYRAVYTISCDNVIIKDNFINRCVNEGVYLSSTSQTDYTLKNTNFSIMNNKINNCGRNGIFIRYCNNFNVFGNMTFNCSTEDITRGGMMVSTESHEGFVCSNISKGANHSYDISISETCENVIEKDNITSIVAS